MKKIVIWMIILCVLIGVITAAALLYKKLGADFGTDNLQKVEPPNEDNTDDKTGTAEEENETVKNTAPDFKVLDAEGKEVSLSDFFGRPIVINFWATWCGYCKEEMPDFDKAAKEYKDVLFMMVNVGESIETGTEYAKAQGFDFALFFDMDYLAAEAYGVTGYPTTFFINADGNLVTYARGKLSYDTLLKGIKTIVN